MKDIHKMNALKMLLFVCIDAFAVIAFAIAKVVAWQKAVVIMVGTVSITQSSEATRFLLRTPHLVLRTLLYD